MILLFSIFFVDFVLILIICILKSSIINNFADNFEGFETWILESKMITTMTGNMGRKSRISTVVVTGNGNGLAGFALAKAPSVKPTLKTAKNRAAQRLMYVPRYKEHTGKKTITNTL